METRDLILKHYEKFPCLQSEDIFKFLFQSAFGCEHLASDYDAALQRIKKEYEEVSRSDSAFTDELDGSYSRVYLSSLNEGLSSETLTKLFCFSAKTEKDGMSTLLQKIEAARELIHNGEIPLCKQEFENSLTKWRESGYPALHHSASFRSTYKPAYRVIEKKYADYLQVFIAIDKLLPSENVILAVEGGSASGKSTLSEMLSSVYDCNVFHTDDFFLRPEQRTPARFGEVGGNLDRERFYDEIVSSLLKNETVSYRPFDCFLQRLGSTVVTEPKRLTVVEGVYSMHPAFGKYYNLSVFLDIAPDFQIKRIEKRNSPALAERFYNEWIPLESIYFEKTAIKSRADITVLINESNR